MPFISSSEAINAYFMRNIHFLASRDETNAIFIKNEFSFYYIQL